MKLVVWVSVTTILWAAVSVTGKCPSIEELKEMAKRAKTYDEVVGQTKKALDIAATGIALGGIVAIIATGGAAAPFVMAGVATVKGVGDVLTATKEVFHPKDDETGLPCAAPDPNIQEMKEMIEQILPAINALSEFVGQRFDELEKKIEYAVQKIENAIGEESFRLSWRTNVIAPMYELRQAAQYIAKDNITSKEFNTDTDDMARLCKGPHTNPRTIASHIWSLFGAGCQKDAPKTITVEGPYCDIHSDDYKEPCIEFDAKCYAEHYIERNEYWHDSAQYLFTLVIGNLLELGTYQGMCANFTYVKPEEIERSNQKFADTVNTTVAEMQKNCHLEDRKLLD